MFFETGVFAFGIPAFILTGSFTLMVLCTKGFAGTVSKSKFDDGRQYNWDFADDFEFNYEVGLAPEFDVDFSSNDKATQYVIKADEETLAARIKNIRKSYGKMTNPDVSADGDVGSRSAMAKG